MAGEGRPSLVRFAVRLTPKGGRDAIEGWTEGPDGKTHLKARVSAPPEDGKANDALVRLLAKALHIASSKVRIVSGATSRLKIVELDTEPPLPPERLAALGTAR